MFWFIINKKVGIISKIFLISLTLIIWATLIFFTFLWWKTDLSKNIKFENIKLWKYYLNKNNKDKFSLIDKDLNIDKNKIFVEQISYLSRFFTNNNKSEILIEENQINIKKWIHLFDLNEVNKNFKINWSTFEITNKWPWLFFVNNLNRSKTIIFSIDTIIDLKIKNKNEILTSVLLYPHSYIIFNQNRNLLIKGWDQLKISQISNLNFFNKKLISQKKINKKFLEIITLKNNEYNYFIEDVLFFLKFESKENYKNFQKYIKRDFISLLWEKYIKKYSKYFVNTQKKKVYYKNLILREIITLFHEDKKNIKKINSIYENIKKLWEVSIDEVKNIENIIYFYYINSLKLENNSINTTINLSELIKKIKNNTEKNQKLEALLFLKNIFSEYDFQKTSNILKKIPLFKEKYINLKSEYDKKSLEYKEIEYLLFFLEKLLTTQFDNIEKYIDKISILLKDYTNISYIFYDDDDDSIKRTWLSKNLKILETIWKIIQKTYFKLERTDEDFLIRKENNILKDKKTISSIKNSINRIINFYKTNIRFLNETKNTIETYQDNINKLTEFFEAMEDYEKYKSKYSVKKAKFLWWDPIKSNKEEKNSLNVAKAYNYIKKFNWISLKNIRIDIYDYNHCINPNILSENQSRDGYCYKINNLEINWNNLLFYLFPYDNNKLNNIKVNNISRKWEYKLDEIKESFSEKLKQNNTEEYEYSFENFFINTFTVQNTTEWKKEEIIYQNDEKNNVSKESKEIWAFKRSKLFWNMWDFSVLKWFLDIKYNDVIVEEDYSIYIKESNFTLDVKNCVSDKCSDNQYGGILESEYKFTNIHSFENVKLKIIDKSLKDNGIDLIWWNQMEIVGSIKINEFENELKKLWLKINNLETSYNHIKKYLKINNVKIKYYASNNRLKIESNYKDKKLIVYIKDWDNIEVYYNWNNMTKEITHISKLLSILFIIRK